MSAKALSDTLTPAIVGNAFSALADRHDKGLSENDIRRSLYHAATWSAIIQAIDPNRRCSVLDIGGGNGVWTIQLARLGHRVVYVDIAERMARIAYTNLLKSGAKANIIIGDAHNLDFLPLNYFDVILAVGDLLCYSQTPSEICYQAYKRCKPGGKMVVAVMGRFGVLQHLTNSLTVEQIKEYISNGWWIEFTQNELENGMKSSLVAHTYTVDELRQLCLSTGWHIQSFFGAGILRTLIGQESLMHLIDQEGIESILSLERELAKAPALLECAMEFGIIVKKPE